MVCIYLLYTYITYIYIIYVQAFILRVALYPDQLEEERALFTSLETGYAGYHVHFSYVAWIYKATLQAISENFAGTDTFCKIFHHIFCVPTSKNSAPLIFRYPRFQFDFSA